MQNDELAQKLFIGDETAFDALIMQNRGLAFYIVNKFTSRSTKAMALKDDLEGEALLALTQAVDQLRNCYEPGKSVTQFLKIVIRRSLSTYLASENIIVVPERTRQRNGEDTPVCKRLSQDIPQPQGDMGEALEDLMACARSDSEKEIVDLLSQGCGYGTISRVTGLSMETVQSYARKIKNRFVNRSLAI